MLKAKIVTFWGVLMSLFTVFVRPVLAANPTCDPVGPASLGVNTALGCVPIKIDEFVVWFLPYLFGVAGGISFLLMVYGFFLMTTSSGDPKVVQGARETVTSAITGLLVAIFAIFILKLIAVKILVIPGIN